MRTLHQTLQRIDGKGYKAYKDIQGTYQDARFRLHIDYVQGDPFASPSRIRLEVPRLETRLVEEWTHTPLRTTAVEDFLARQMSRAIGQQKGMRAGTGKSGMIAIDTPGQEVLKRTAVRVTKKHVEFRLSVGLPAQGRRILGRQAANMLVERLPLLLEQALNQWDEQQLIDHVELSDQQDAIRRYLQDNGYVSFIANGAVLPRESGISNRPLQGEGVIPFQSPPEMEIEIELPHAKTTRGMGIKKGVTLIVGGGYHGKSTLLKAIERGVYNHIPGDGREYVITDETACKVRAEDGRGVTAVNISPFIANLPYGKETTRFSSEDASGSTSQAANIVEMLEIGAKTLLIDEDTSATNFMIRDARMQELVVKDKEPITPFVDKVRQLHVDLGVSTVLVLGGSGDYLDVADHVVLMEEYRPVDVTVKAREIAERIQNARKAEGGGRFGERTPRVPHPRSFDARKGKKEKVDAKGLHSILFGMSHIDLSFVEQLVDASQTRAIANMIRWLTKKEVDGRTDIGTMLARVESEIEHSSLDSISPFYGQHPGDLAMPRKFEVAAAINRLRTLDVESCNIV